MKIFKNILLIVLVLSGISCSDFLQEKGYKTDYTYYNTADGLNALVIACYQNTRYAASYENQYIMEDMGTDLYMLGGDGGARDAFGQYLSSAMTPQNGSVSGLWNNNYQAIYACNLGLQYIDKNTDMAAATKSVRKGELLFLRSYYYYQLAIQFGDIPLTLEAASVPKTDYYRVPQKQIWAQIIADARKAWDLLPWADASGKVTGDYGRVGKGAVGHLLAQSYMFRYSDTYTKNQSDAKMNEDRGGKTSDLDSVIYYASRVCNFDQGAGSGSNHALAADYATLWGWDSKKGLTAEYAGSEILFSINYSTTYFYNNAPATDVNTGGNWLHLLYNGQFENYPLTTKLENGTSTSWGNNVGLVRDMLTGRPWRRIAPTPYYYSDNGLYAAKNYESGKPGKLIDSRLYKSHNWFYFCNSSTVDTKWATFTNPAGTFDPASKGYTVGTNRYNVGDTAIVLSLEDVSKRPGPGTAKEKLALARAQEKYWYVPMQSITVPLTRGAVAGYDVTTNQFPSSAKYLDSRRAAQNDQGGFRSFYRMRLAETYILLSEAYARKAFTGGGSQYYQLAADALNKVRLRAAYKSTESKYPQYWKYDGGSYADKNASTENDMKVSAAFIQAQAANNTNLTDFYLDEYGHETAGELNRFDLLVRFGADYWYKRVKADNYWTSNDNGQSSGNIHLYHRFRPIPQSHIDNIHPSDPNPQNYGY